MTAGSTSRLKEVRQAEPRGVGHRGEVDPVAGGHHAGAVGRGDLAEGRVQQDRQQVAEHQAEQDRDAGPEAPQQQRGDDDEGHRRQRHPLVLRPVDAGHDRCQVEADQQDDRAGDRRRQHRVQEADAGDVDEHTDQGQHDAGDQDRADDVGGVPAGGPDGDHAADERGAGAQVARHLPVDDEQEDDRRDPAHHDRQVGVEPHDDREDEGRAEHGHDVLGADADRPRPGQPLVRGHRLAQRWGLPVPVELPAERHERLHSTRSWDLAGSP
jgi:hypothetical protein